MLRRLASLGQPSPGILISDPKDDMSLSSDAPPSPKPSIKPSSGLAGVFRGLTGSRLQASRSTPSETAVAPSPPPPDALANDGYAPSSLSFMSYSSMSNLHVTKGLRENHQAMFEKLRTGSPAERKSAASGLRYVIRECQVETAMGIWRAAKDMIQGYQLPDVRNAGWELVTECVTHRDLESMHRRELFDDAIKTKAHPDDFYLQLAALEDLTSHGRELSGLDYEVSPLLTEWLTKTFYMVSAARKEARATKAQAKVSTVNDQETNFQKLFEFLQVIIKTGFSFADDAVVCRIIDTLIKICTETRETKDIGRCINVLNTLVTFRTIPAARLGACVKLMGTIYSMISQMRDQAWKLLSILLDSHDGQAVVRHLLEVLRAWTIDSSVQNSELNEIKGALVIIEKIMEDNYETKKYHIPFTVLADGLETSARAIRQSSFDHKLKGPTLIFTSILRIINLLLGDGTIHPLAMDEDWTVILRVAEECCKNPTNALPLSDAEPQKHPLETAKLLDEQINILYSRLVNLAHSRSKSPEIFLPRQSIIKFFSNIVRYDLPDSGVQVILDYFAEFRCYSPSDPEWERNIELVLDFFFMDQSRSTEIRLKALAALTEANEINDVVTDSSATKFMPKMARTILSSVNEEFDIAVLQAVMSLMISVAVNADEALFDEILIGLKAVIDYPHLNNDLALQEPSYGVGKLGTPSNVVMKGFVTLFTRIMDVDGQKCASLFELILAIVGSNEVENDARLSAAKFLFSLRADFAHRIYISPDSDCDYLADLMGRTDESYKRKQAEDASRWRNISRMPVSGKESIEGSSTGATSMNDNTERGTDVWWKPDPDALTEPIFSRILVSRIPGAEPAQVRTADDYDDDDDSNDGPPDDGDVEINVDGDESAPEDEGNTTQDEGFLADSARIVSLPGEEASGPVKICLPINYWMDTVCGLLLDANSCPWELYTYVLVHLPSQLTNHSLFCDSIEEILKLRALICEQLIRKEFAEPLAGTGLRRADLAICLFQSLTMLISYHEHFSRNEQDEIISVFVHGIGKWERCAKPCIHALSICCHELPQSTIRSVKQLLPLMAKVITQPYVAMHILEFLCVLGRMPHIYSNFREDDYNFTFGICFRYLQYVRDKRKSLQRSGTGSGAPSDLYGGSPATQSIDATSAQDLPQYVYALAYHVVIFWFLALKLPDRQRYVHWIAINLFKDANGPEGPEEQAIVTMDFMQRVTYADINENKADPSFNKEKFGQIEKKNWLLGNSVITIEQATSTGWTQLTKRQPSGTNSYVFQHELSPSNLHQGSLINESPVKIMPEHFMLNLCLSLPQPYPSQWPVPLPDDDATARAIRSFDRNLSIDGHKIGVVYIGENQTNEVDILANVSGSGDYMTFVNGLGTLTRLKGATFNTQGLDREYDTDGKFAFCWRDRVTEIVYHVTTQMPTNREVDPQLIGKKKHIGNDFVNIIWNDSGLPFRFDTFPSEFNYVNIIITPESRSSFVDRREQTTDVPSAEDTINPGAKVSDPIPAQQLPKSHNPFFRVKVMSKPGFPEISPAAETKMVSLRALPGFIRLLAMNASVFSLVWAGRMGGEHTSSWRNRLREIKRLHERTVAKIANAPEKERDRGAFYPPQSASFMHEASGGPQAGQPARAPANLRETFNSSLRRSSVAIFLTGGSSSSSSSAVAAAQSGGGTVGAEGKREEGRLAGVPEEEGGLKVGEVVSVLESLDFSKWA